MTLNNIRVVITGASSGIGAATAIAFAQEGARLVLGARGKEGLDDIARRCRAAGATVDTASIDVTDADAVASFAHDARDTLGGIDLWFSDVGIGVVGKYHEVPLADPSVSPTDAVVLCCALLRGQDLNPFDLGLWFGRVAPPPGTRE